MFCSMNSWPRKSRESDGSESDSARGNGRARDEPRRVPKSERRLRRAVSFRGHATTRHRSLQRVEPSLRLQMRGRAELRLRRRDRLSKVRAKGRRGRRTTAATTATATTPASTTAAATTASPSLPSSPTTAPTSTSTLRRGLSSLRSGAGSGSCGRLRTLATATTPGRGSGSLTQRRWQRTCACSPSRSQQGRRAVGSSRRLRAGCGRAPFGGWPMRGDEEVKCEEGEQTSMRGVVVMDFFSSWRLLTWSSPRAEPSVPALS